MIFIIIIKVLTAYSRKKYTEIISKIICSY